MIIKQQSQPGYLTLSLFTLAYLILKWLISCRRMFPTLALSFLGMDPRRYYSVHVDIVPVDGYAYTFVNNMWQVNGMASEMHALPYIQSYQADEVAHTGLYWMKNGVDFKKVRLTNRRVGPFKDGEVMQFRNYIRKAILYLMKVQVLINLERNLLYFDISTLFWNSRGFRICNWR